MLLFFTLFYQDFLAVLDVQTLGRISHTLTCEVEGATFSICNSDFLDTGNYVGKFDCQTCTCTFSSQVCTEWVNLNARCCMKLQI